MFHIVLYQPEIPPNTGNIIRLCANAGATLHLIHPLGFEINEKQIRRSGMDYRDMTVVQEHDDWAAFLAAVKPKRLFAVETTGTKTYSDVAFEKDDVLLFGNEGSGLPADILSRLEKDHELLIPMCGDSRSLNLSNSVALVLYEAWRQQGFTGQK